MARKPRSKSSKSSTGRKGTGGRKPRSQWSPAYRKRIERAEAKGLSRQAARGHRGGREHVSRKAGFGLTPAQSAAITKFAKAQAAKDRNGPDPIAAANALKAWAREKGFARFLELKNLNEARHAEKRTRVRVVQRVGGGRTAVAHISVGVHDLSADFEDFDLPNMPDGDDFAWLFYH
jgi:hypothetical protein